MSTPPRLDPSPAAAAATGAAAGVRGRFARMWLASPPLTATGVVMTAAAAASLVGVLVDPRIITDAPAWLKPLKFALSSAIYAFTLAWIFTHLLDRPRVRSIVGWATAIVFVLEVGIIDVQAARGTISHFNAATGLDQALYLIMGAAIMVQTLISVAVAVVLWRQRFTDRPLGWALRFGMTLTIAGALTGALMTRPTSAQLDALRAGAQVTAIGGHTVGGPDGGAGLPVTRWSRDHGDVRVPHFIGLHAMQALALVAVGLRRWRRSDAARVRAMGVAGASYAALFGLTLWQALSGHSVVALDTGILPLALWATATGLAITAVTGGRRMACVRAQEVAA